jgi:hypothetical protein
MPEFERRITVGLDADSAFDRLAEPAQLPNWLVGISLDESIAVDGDPNLQDQGEAAPVAPSAQFRPDRVARTIEWASPSGDYAGTLEVKPMLAGMCSVTVRLQTRDPVKAAAADDAFDGLVKKLQRRLTA